MKTQMHKTFGGVFTLLLSHGAAHAQTITADAPLDRSQKHEIALFVQEIASAPWDGDFENGKPSNDALTSFGIYQTALRRYKLFKPGKDADSVRLAASYVDEAALKYLGRTPQHRSILKDSDGYRWTLRDGFYHGYSENFENLGVAQPTSIRIQRAGSSQPTIIAAWPDEADEGTVRARLALKRVTSGGHRRWILWSFKTLSPRR